VKRSLSSSPSPGCAPGCRVAHLKRLRDTLLRRSAPAEIANSRIVAKGRKKKKGRDKGGIRGKGGEGKMRTLPFERQIVIKTKNIHHAAVSAVLLWGKKCGVQEISVVGEKLGMRMLSLETPLGERARSFRSFAETLLLLQRGAGAFVLRCQCGVQGEGVLEGCVAVDKKEGPSSITS
jgi:hypothetical protein